MMPIQHIFLDLDGVLVDFHQACLDAYRKSYLCTSSSWPIKQHIHDLLGVSAPELLQFMIGRDWSCFPETTFARDIVQTCWRVAAHAGLSPQHAISVLTDPSFSAAVVVGKVQWLAKQFPMLAARCSFTHAKEQFAHRGAILVDDRLEVAERFYSAGGNAVVLPQPWNDWEVAYGSPQAPRLEALLNVVVANKTERPLLLHDQSSFEFAQESYAT